MLASLSFLTTLVTTALVLTVIAPFLLIILFVIDYKKGNLW